MRNTDEDQKYMEEMMKGVDSKRRGLKYLCGLALLAMVILPNTVQAGDLDSPAAPTDAGSAMYTLDDVYNRLGTGAAGAKRPGSFREPSAGPGATGHTLNELMAITPAADNTSGASPADVFMGKTFWGLRTDGSWGPKTGMKYVPVVESGQTTSYTTGDDGTLRSGITPPTPRFTDNNNGTVTDNLTGLIWLKNANCFNMQTWDNALTSANSLASGGSCGLTDGSNPGQWRLPQIKELRTLIDSGRYNPALPAGHPFTGVQSSLYWSSTTHASTSYAWVVGLNYGNVDGYHYKPNSHYVWPVRGGQ